MKKAIPFIIIMTVLCTNLVACSNQTSSSQASSSSTDQFRIVIRQNSENNIYGVHHEYLIDGIPIGGGEVMSVIKENVVPIKPGEEIGISFEKQDFPEDSDLSNLTVEIYIIAQDGNEIKTDNDIELSPTFGETYRYNLTGNPDSYSINRITDETDSKLTAI